MIRQIDPNAAKYFPDVKMYIEEKSQIDVEKLTEIVPDNHDNVEISDNAKFATKAPVNEAEAVEDNSAQAEDAEVPAGVVDTYR